MRTSWKTLVAAVAALLVVPQLATAEDVQEQLLEMQERMRQLEDSLQATNDQLEQANQRVAEQQQIMERAGLDDERSAISALSKFLNETEFSGLVAASYNWNFANPDNNLNFNPARPATFAGENTGSLGLTAPFHRAHNSFQVDQVLIAMEKAATPDSRAGFAVDIAFGVSADNQGGAGFSGDQTYLHQGYASYLAPVAVGDGITVKAGRYETPIGAEVFRQDQNFNITRGLLWSLQPVTHTGVIASADFGQGLFGALGIANSIGGAMIDTDSVKTGIAQIGWASDRASVILNGILAPGDTGFSGPTGQGPYPNATDEGMLSLVDLVATCDPSDNLSVWLNFDWWHSADDGDGRTEWNVYAVAAAGRLALSDKTGASTRFEYVRGTEICPAAGAAGCGGASVGNDDLELYSITLTLDHSLTENLMVRGEYRYDYAEADGSRTQDFFTGETDFGRDNQHLALVEMVYSF